MQQAILVITNLLKYDLYSVNKGGTTQSSKRRAFGYSRADYSYNSGFAHKILYPKEPHKWRYKVPFVNGSKSFNEDLSRETLDDALSEIDLEYFHAVSAYTKMFLYVD